MIKGLLALRHNQGFLRYFHNTSWMFVEQGVKIVSSLFVGIYVARYLGPEGFGVLSYAIAVVGIFMALSRLGMESILVRELVSHPEQRRQYLGTSFGLMLISAVVCMFSVGAIVTWFEADLQVRLYIVIISIGLLFQSFLVIDYAFQSQIKAKYSSVSKSISLIISSGIKIYFVLIQADLLLFVIAYALDQALIALSLVTLHIKMRQPNFLFSFDIRLVKPLLKSSWPMVVSAVAIMLYMRVDQIMIENILNSEQLGLYAAMTRIYEGWVMVPVILCASLLPAIVKSKDLPGEQYEKRLTYLFAAVFWSSTLVAVFTTIFREETVRYTFGDEYVAASSVLVIIMWSAAFAALGSVTLRYLVAEKMEKKIIYRTTTALIINIVLNLVLIPVYGIEGAAIATLICIITANYLIDFFDADLKRLVSIKNQVIWLGLFSIINTKKIHD